MYVGKEVLGWVWGQAVRGWGRLKGGWGLGGGGERREGKREQEERERRIERREKLPISVKFSENWKRSNGVLNL